MTSYIKTSIEKDQMNKKIFNVTLVLRSNGTVQVYSDYEFTGTIDFSKEKVVSKDSDGKTTEEPLGLYCVDIEADTEYFYFRCLNLKT